MFNFYEIDNLFGSEYDIEMSDEEQMFHNLCNNETNGFQNIFNLINYLRNNLLNELKELDIVEKELKEMKKYE